MKCCCADYDGESVVMPPAPLEWCLGHSVVGPSMHVSVCDHMLKVCYHKILYPDKLDFEVKRSKV